MLEFPFYPYTLIPTPFQHSNPHSIPVDSFCNPNSFLRFPVHPSLPSSFHFALLLVLYPIPFLIPFLCVSYSIPLWFPFHFSLIPGVGIRLNALAWVDWPDLWLQAEWSRGGKSMQHIQQLHLWRWGRDWVKQLYYTVRWVSDNSCFSLVGPWTGRHFSISLSLTLKQQECISKPHP